MLLFLAAQSLVNDRIQFFKNVKPIIEDATKI